MSTHKLQYYAHTFQHSAVETILGIMLIIAAIAGIAYFILFYS